MSTYRQHLQLLQQSSYRYFLINSVLAAVGNGLSYVALAWLVIRVHSTVSAVAVLMTCFWLPMVLFGPIAGVISDRFHRLWLMVLANGCRALLFIFFGIYLYYYYSLLLIYLFAFINGSFFALYNPAMFTFIREVVSEKQLLLANTQLDISYEVGNVIGMGLAGLVMALVSAPMTLMINGVFFVFSTLVLLPIKYTPHDELLQDKRTLMSIWPDFKQGLRYLLDRKVLYVLYTLQLLIFVEFMTAPILLAPYAKNILHATAGEFGQIEAAMSVGIVIGGIFNPALAVRFGTFKVLLVEILLSGLGFVAFSFTTHYQAAIFLYFIIGLALSSWPLMVTRAQELTELSFQGRVQGTFNSIAGFFILLLYFAVNYLGDYASIQTLYLLELIFALLAGLLVLRYRHLLK